MIAPAVLLALWVVGRERAAWLAVPAIWPAQQFYYGTLVMPTRSKVAAAIVAFPVAGSGAAALFASRSSRGANAVGVRQRGLDALAVAITKQGNKRHQYSEASHPE